MKTEFITLIDERIEALQEVNRSWKVYMDNNLEFSKLPEPFKKLVLKTISLNEKLIEDGEYLKKVTDSFDYVKKIKSYILFADRAIDFIRDLLNIIN